METICELNNNNTEREYRKAVVTRRLRVFCLFVFYWVKYTPTIFNLAAGKPGPYFSLNDSMNVNSSNYLLFSNHACIFQGAHGPDSIKEKARGQEHTLACEHANHVAAFDLFLGGSTPR